MFGQAFSTARVSFALSLCLALPVLCWCPVVTGAEASFAEARVVEVTILASGEEGPNLRASLFDVGRRLGIDFRNPDELGTERPLLRVVVDLRSSALAQVLITDGRTGAVWLRREVRREGSDEVMREELSHVIHVGLETALDPSEHPPPAAPQPIPPRPSAVPSVPRPPLRPPPKAPAPPEAVVPEASSLPWSLAFGAAAGARLAGENAWFVPGAGLSVAGSLGSGPWHPSLTLSGDVRLPFEVRSAAGSLRMTSFGFRASPALSLVTAQEWSLEAGVSGGIDGWSAVAHPILPGSVPRSSPLQLTAVFGVGLTTRLQLGNGFRLVWGLGADFDTTPMRFVAAGGGVNAAMFEPFAVRPFTTLGVELEVAGQPSREVP